MYDVKILVAEDDLRQRKALVRWLEKAHFGDVDEAGYGREAIRKIGENLYDIIIADKNMPEEEGVNEDKEYGIEILKYSKARNPDTEVIIITAYPTTKSAFHAGGLAAYKYLEKPVDPQKQLLPLIEEIVRKQSLKREARRLNEPCGEYQIVGTSTAILELMKQIRIVAPQDVTVLIYGETGSGKELVARNIHLNSKRSKAAFVAKNCGAFAQQLLESDLFGHERGAFTGAIAQRKGIFEYADGGTIFLDEIGDTSLELQKKLLRVLQEREFERVGGNVTIKTDARLIAATNKDLKEEVKLGNFRKDLFFRLDVIPLHVPLLKDRKEDIPLLAHYFREKFSSEQKKSIRDFDNEVIEILTDYSWPGNVRELENKIERATTYCEGMDIILPMHLPPDFQKSLSAPPKTEINHLLNIKNFKEAKNAFEKLFLETKLQENNWNISQTAMAIGFSRSKLHQKMKEYQLSQR